MNNNPLRNAKIVGENVDPRAYHLPNAVLGDSERVMSASQLKAFLDCPKEWHAGVETEDTKSTDWGNIIDCVVLTPENWTKYFAICPETYPDTKTGEPKPWTFNAGYCKKWREDHEGFQIIKSQEANNAVVAEHTLRENDVADKAIKASKKQVYVTSEYYDEETGLTIPLKSLIDLVPNLLSPLPKTLIDLKTCRSVHPRAFKSHVHEYGYALSAALYLDAYNAATSESREDFRFILQKNSEPWTTGLRFLNAEWLNFGRRQYVLALQEYAQCLEAGKWPSHEERAMSRGEVVIDGFLEVGPEAYMLGGWQ